MLTHMSIALTSARHVVTKSISESCQSVMQLETGQQGCDTTPKVCPSKPQGCPKEPPGPYCVRDLGGSSWRTARSVRSDIGIISSPRSFILLLAGLQFRYPHSHYRPGQYDQILSALRAPVIPIKTEAGTIHACSSFPMYPQYRFLVIAYYTSAVSRILIELTYCSKLSVPSRLIRS